MDLQRVGLPNNDNGTEPNEKACDSQCNEGSTFTASDTQDTKERLWQCKRSGHSASEGLRSHHECNGVGDQQKS